MASSGRHHIKQHAAASEAVATSNIGFLSKAAMVVAIAEPLMTLPQIYQIWSTKNVQGVSALTWALYVVASLVWLAYGLKIKNKPLIFTGILWVFMEIAVLIGIFWLA